MLHPSPPAPSGALAAAALATLLAAPAAGQCPTEPTLVNGAGVGSVSCPCFVAGEEAGAVFDLPPADFPIEILKVQIGWGSQFGGQPDSLEQAIHIYPAGLPNPGVPQLSIVGPQLTDGFLNEFTLPIPEVMNAGPFTVTLEFANSNAGQLFSPTIVHDGAGCSPGQNVVFAMPGGWNDACALGVTGNWTVNVVYRKVNCGQPIEYCVPKPSSSFCLADALTSDLGNAPISGANDYSVLTNNVQAFRNGIFFFGLNGQLNVPFQGGTLCVNPPLARSPIMNSGGSVQGACDGGYAMIVNDGVNIWDPGPGNTVWVQTWYRDPPVDVFGTALSDAVEIPFL